MNRVESENRYLSFEDGAAQLSKSCISEIVNSKIVVPLQFLLAKDKKKFKSALNTNKIQCAKDQYRTGLFVLEFFQILTRLWLQKHPSEQKLKVAQAICDIVVHPLVLRQSLPHVIPTNSKQELIQELANKHPFNTLNLLTLFVTIVPHVNEAVHTHVKKDRLVMLRKCLEKMERFIKQVQGPYQIYKTYSEIKNSKKTFVKLVSTLSLLTIVSKISISSNTIDSIISQFLKFVGSKPFQKADCILRHSFNTLRSAEFRYLAMATALVFQHEDLIKKPALIAGDFMGFNIRKTDAFLYVISKCTATIFLAWNFSSGFKKSVMDQNKKLKYRFFVDLLNCKIKLDN